MEEVPERESAGWSRRWPATFMLLGIVLTWVAVGAWAFHVFRPTPQPEVIASRPVTNWTRYTNGAESLGDEHAPTIMVIFSDYQCPFCRALNEELEGLQRANAHQFRIIVRNDPLSIHPYSYGAAIAAVCAGMQSRFAVYHNHLFAQQDSIGLKSWVAFARDVNIPDLEHFSRCLTSDTAAAVVARDTVAATELDLQGTPAILLNGKLLQGAVESDTLAAYIERALR